MAQNRPPKIRDPKTGVVKRTRYGVPIRRIQPAYKGPDSTTRQRALAAVRRINANPDNSKKAKLARGKWLTQK